MKAHDKSGSRYFPHIRAREQDLARGVAAGRLDARELAEGHWRLFLRGQEASPRAVDYWPRTGRMYCQKLRQDVWGGIDGAVQFLTTGRVG